MILLLVTYPHFDEQYSIDDSAPVTTVHSEDKTNTKLNEDNAKQIETEIIKETEVETLSDNSIEILYKNGKSIKEISKLLELKVEDVLMVLVEKDLL